MAQAQEVLDRVYEALNDHDAEAVSRLCSEYGCSTGDSFLATRAYVSLRPSPWRLCLSSGWNTPPNRKVSHNPKARYSRAV
jgi:hypothetical protein